MEKKTTIYALRIKGLTHHVVCGAEESEISSTDVNSYVNLYKPIMVGLGPVDQKTGTTEAVILSMFPPFTKGDVKSVPMLRGDILYYLPVNDKMESLYRRTVSDITIPEISLAR